MSSVHANVAIAPSSLDAVQSGTVFEKTPIGWNVKWVDWGTVVFLQGATITEALGSHGAQIIHPVKAVPEGIVEVELPVVASVAAIVVHDEGHGAHIAVDVVLESPAVASVADEGAE